MLYGVFADVHSNLEALNAVLAFFESCGVGGYICCGDLVGYGPDPNPCLERVRALKNASIICGNHDLAAVGRMEIAAFNPYARAAVLWTHANLSEASRGYLESLKAKLEHKDFTLVHGTPRRPPDEYLLNGTQFKDNMSYIGVWPLFIGHSHMPLCFRLSEEHPGGVETLFLEDQQTIEVRRQAKKAAVAVAFNPGSVGQPRDQDRRASCALYDSDKGLYHAVRLDYDVAAVQAKIRACGLPEYLALRLAYGQ